MRRFFARLLRRADPQAPAPAPSLPSFEDQLQAKVEDVVSNWQEAVRVASARAYITGHAAGELAGRQALAHEMQVAYGVDGGDKPLDADELETLATRQLH